MDVDTRPSAELPRAERRERNRLWLLRILHEHELSNAAAAELMRVPFYTLKGWLKTESPNAAPDMAVELLCLKLREPLPPWLR